MPAEQRSSFLDRSPTSPGTRFFRDLPAIAEKAGLKPAIVSSSSTQRSTTSRPSQKHAKPLRRFVTATAQGVPFVDLTLSDDDDDTPVFTKPAATQSGVIDFTNTSDSEDDEDIKPIPIMPPKSEAQRRREMEEDKRKGLNQSRLSFGGGPGAGSRPLSYSSSQRSSGSLAPTLGSSPSPATREPLTNKTSTPKVTAPPVMTKGKAKERAEPPALSSQTAPPGSTSQLKKYPAPSRESKPQPTVRSSASRSIQSLPRSQSSFSLPANDATPSPEHTPAELHGGEPKSFEPAFAAAAKKSSGIFKTANDTKAYAKSSRAVSRADLPTSTAPESRNALPTPATPHVSRQNASPEASSASRRRASEALDEVESVRHTRASSRQKSTEPTQVASRPTRARPVPGAYEIPSLDAAIWPTVPRSTHVTTRRKRKVEGVKREVDVVAEAVDEKRAEESRDRDRGISCVHSLGEELSSSPEPEKQSPAPLSAVPGPRTPTKRDARKTTSRSTTPQSSRAAVLFSSRSSQSAPTKQRSPLKSPSKLSNSITLGGSSSKEVEQMIPPSSPLTELTELSDEEEEEETKTPTKSSALSVQSATPRASIPKAESVKEVEVEQEPIEVEVDLDDIDLTEWDNFAWSAKPEAPTTPVKSDPGFSTPLKRASSVAQVTPRRSSSKRASAGLVVPDSVKKRKVEQEKWDRIVEETRVAKEAEEMEQRKKEEESARKIEEIVAEQPDQDEEEEDMGALLASGLEQSPQKASSSNLPDAVQSRQEAANARKEEQRLKKEVRDAEKKAAAKRKQEAKERDQQQRRFDRTLQGIKTGREEEAVWDEIDNSDDSEDDLSDVGTDEELDLSDADDPMEDDEREFDLDNVAAQLKSKGLAVDDNLLRDAKKGAFQAEAPLNWDGFWETSFKTTSGGIEIPEMDIASSDEFIREIKECCSQRDISALATIVSSGGLNLINKEHDLSVCKWLFMCALSAVDARWASTAATTLIQWISTRSPSLADSLVPWTSLILSQLGARKSILACQGLHDLSSPMVISKERDQVCIQLLRFLTCVLTKQLGKTTFSRLLLPSLLLLGIDTSSSDALKSHVVDAVRTLLLIHTIAQRLDDEPRMIAAQIVKSTESYGPDVRCAVLQFLGETTAESRDVYTWLGAEYLFESLGAGRHQTNKPSVPPITKVIPVVDQYSDSLRPAPTVEIDWVVKNFEMTFMFATINNPAKILDAVPPKLTSDESGRDLMQKHIMADFRHSLKASMNSIPDQSDGSKRPTVKARLHELVETIDLLFEEETSRRIRARKLGPGLKFGKNGQSRLNMSKGKGKAEV
ncbi:hypothetical protein L198_03302 [Cryptococcus wingfieldii CBS 7118]|uniref:Uncharacterized protein n=1 Tax=Cryptococcus wingfieldii CBS 7118 TaxID=1295528 RepID=A0A1E3JEZ9_9TREE|nr:hypothetical protein L198_03302 [Cryptococcus wingfieldii CBS 7118]ODN99458.1 hypothetical protein L198_03302 [Cryptococcus wingfieldii CBS 7118]